MLDRLKLANERREKAKALKSENGAYKGHESDIQRAVEQHASNRGLHLIHVPDQIWAFVKGLTPHKGLPRFFIDWFIDTFKGLPDCLVYHKGKTWSAELKKIGGSAKQVQIKKMEILGAKLFRNAQDAIEDLEQWIKNNEVEK